MNRIGILGESSIHAALKELYSQPGDKIEEPVAGFLVDIFRGDEVIEIQTGNFTALKPKLEKLLDSYRVRVVIPVAIERHIVRIANNGSVLSSRRSPKKGRVEDLFYELVRVTRFLTHPNFVLEVAFVVDIIRWIDDGKGSWRRNRWSIQDRLMLNFIGSRQFYNKDGYAAFIPELLSKEFTSREFAEIANLSPRHVSKMLYCLRAMNIVKVVGKRGKAFIYQRCE